MVNNAHVLHSQGDTAGKSLISEEKLEGAGVASKEREKEYTLSPHPISFPSLLRRLDLIQRGPGDSIEVN